jgi:hypothetical protein
MPSKRSGEAGRGPVCLTSEEALFPLHKPESIWTRFVWRNLEELGKGNVQVFDDAVVTV